MEGEEGEGSASSTDGGGNKSRERRSRAYNSLTTEFFSLLNSKTHTQLPGTQGSHTQIHTKSANFEDIYIYFSILEALNEFRTLTSHYSQMKAGRKSKKCIYMHRESLLT